MDKPLSFPEANTQNRWDHPSRPAERRDKGSMGIRQVSGSLPETFGTPVNERCEAAHIAGADHPPPGLRSHRVIAASPRRFWRPPVLQGEDAPLIRPYPDIRPSPKVKVLPGLPGGADRPPQSAEGASDFPGVIRRLKEIRAHYTRLSSSNVAQEFTRALDRAAKRVAAQFKTHGGHPKDLPKGAPTVSQPERMYLGLTELARQAELDGDLSRASNIRSALAAADQCAIEELRSLSDTYDTGMSPAPQRSQLQPAPDEPTATAAALLSPASTPPEFEWFSAYKLLRGLTKRLCDMGWSHACMQVDAAHTAISRRIMRSFRQAGGQTGQLHVCFTEVTKPERAWRVLQGMLAQAECSSDAQRVYELRATASAIAKVAYNKLAALTDKYGPIERLSSMSTEDLRALQTRLAIVEPSILATQPGGPSASVAAEAAAIPQHPATAPETTTPSLPATAATPCAVPQASPWLQDDYAVERALIAGNLPPGFDASRLISDAYTFDRFGIAAELKAGRLPMQVINERLREREESAEAASDALLFQYLRFFKEKRPVRHARRVSGTSRTGVARSGAKAAARA